VVTFPGHQFQGQLVYSINNVYSAICYQIYLDRNVLHFQRKITKSETFICLPLIKSENSMGVFLVSAQQLLNVPSIWNGMVNRLWYLVLYL